MFGAFLLIIGLMSSAHYLKGFDSEKDKHNIEVTNVRTKNGI